MAFTEEEIKADVATMKARGDPEDRIIDFVQKARAAGENAAVSKEQPQDDSGGLRAPPRSPYEYSSVSPMMLRSQEGENLMRTADKVIPSPESLIRYGLPVTAGLAAAPAVGTGLGSMAAMSGVGALSSGAGEWLAQMYEGKSDPRKVMGSAMLGATPVSQYGGSMTRIAANVPMAIGFNELAKYAESDFNSEQYAKDFHEQGLGSRWGIPAGITGVLSGLGGMGGKLKNAGDKRSAISKERFGGSVLIGEVFPEMVKSEANAIARGNRNAQEALMNMDANIGKEILTHFPEVQSTSDIANELRGMHGQLSKLQSNAQKARDEFTQLTALAEEARVRNAPEYRAIAKKAEEKAFEVTQAKAVYQAGVNKMFGGKQFALDGIGSPQLAENLKELATGAKETVKKSIDDLYSRAGIDVNDPVVSVAEIGDALKRAASDPKGALKDNDLRKAFINTIKDKLKGRVVNGNIPLGVFRRLKSEIADDLVAKGKDVNAANRVAAEQYKVVQEAADNFMLKNAGSKWLAWTEANASAAAHFGAKDANAINMIEKGDIDGLVKSLQGQNAKATLNELQTYKDVIANTFDAAKDGARETAQEAANTFMEGVNKSIAGHIVNSTLDRTSGLSNNFKAIQFEKLAGELQKMKSNGFPIETLGLGTAEEVTALARAASARKGGFTADETNEFFDLLPQLGLDKTKAILDYRKSIKEYYFSADTKLRARKEQAMIENARKAGVSAQQAHDEMIRAQKNPLMVLMDRTGLSLGSDIKANGRFVDGLLSLDPELATEFMSVYRQSNPANANRISKAAASTVMRQMADFVANGPDKADISSLANTFFNPSNTAELNTFKALIGPEEFQNIRNKFMLPVQRIAGSMRATGLGSAYAPFQNVRGKVAAMQGQQLYGSLGGLINLLKDSKYNTIYTLYVDPKWSPKFAKAGYNMDRFVASGPVERMALNLASQEDDKAGEARP